MNRLKFRLLLWLLGDICERSECKHCRLRGNGRYDCKQSDVFAAARRAWKIK